MQLPTSSLPSSHLNTSTNHIIRPDSFDRLFLNRQNLVNNQSPSPPLPVPQFPPLLPVLNNNNNENNENIIQNNPIDLQVVQVNLEEGNNENVESDKDVHKDTIIECFWNLLFSHLAGIFFICTFLYKFNYVAIFVVLFIQDLYDMYLIAPKAKGRKSYRVFFFEKMLMIGFHLIVLVYLLTEAFYLVYAIIPLAGQLVTRMVKYSMDKYLKDCQSILDFFEIGLKLFTFLQGLTIFCKIDSFMTWTWSEVFWPYWVLFSVLIGIDFGMFFMFLSKFCQILFASSNMMEFKGIVWMGIMCVSFTVISCMTVISLSSFLDDYEDLENNSDLYNILYTLIASFLINEAILYIWRKDIMEFLASSAEEGSSEDGSDEEDGNEKEKDKEQTAWVINSAIPKFLMKFSSTYFKKTDVTSAYIKTKIHKKKHKKHKKQKFAGMKSKSFTVFEPKNPTSPVILKNYKKGEKDGENMKDLLKNKKILKTILGEERKEGNEKYKLEQIPPKILDDSPLRSPTKGHKNLKHLVIDDKKNSNEEKNVDKLKMTKSATLPLHHKLSDFYEQMRNQSNQEIVSPSPGGKTKMDDLNPTCLVCFDKLPNAVFMNCGHGGVCYECALEIFKATKECYLCRTKIMQVLEIDTKELGEDYFKVLQGVKLPSFTDS